MKAFSVLAKALHNKEGGKVFQFMDMQARPKVFKDQLLYVFVDPDYSLPNDSFLDSNEFWKDNLKFIKVKWPRSAELYAVYGFF